MMTFEEFGDGRDERMDALNLEMRLRGNPKVTARRKAYDASVGGARKKAASMTKAEIIDALCNSNSGYIRSMLETEDDRFGSGSLIERYARTFWVEFQKPEHNN
jgi:hypothetical protein